MCLSSYLTFQRDNLGVSGWALTFCRKQSDGDDSEDEEVVKRPKAVRGFFTVHVFPVFVRTPTCASILFVNSPCAYEKL